MEMNNKAFIFTMDAILALVPVFIVVSSVTVISTQESASNYYKSVESVKIASDILESLRITGDINTYDTVRLKSLIDNLIPDKYNYSYTIYTTRGGVVANFSRGNLEDAKNVYTAHKTATFSPVHVEDYAFAISHNGSSATAAFCELSGQKIWELSFTYLPRRFNYYLLGYKKENMPVNYLITTERQNCSSSLSGKISTNFMLPSTNFKRMLLSEGSTYTGTTMTSGNTYYVYIRPVGTPTKVMDFYVVYTPLEIEETDVTIQNIYRMRRFIVRLSLWEK